MRFFVAHSTMRAIQSSLDQKITLAEFGIHDDMRYFLLYYINK